MSDVSPNFSLDWPYAYGAPTAAGDFRTTPEDFIVDEVLGFEPSGEGEHVLLHIRKRGDNTNWVANQIADLAGVKPMDVGYCGLKDRHAVTTQWFSVYLGKKPEADWQRLNSESIELLAVARHSQKLRRGTHQANQFQITLRNVEGDTADIDARLAAINKSGVPNYFGEQRFGREGGNLPQAQRLLVEGQRMRDKQKRGLILSAARSYLFNEVVSFRVGAGTWQQQLAGEAVLNDAPTAPLWGRGRSQAADEALAVEQQALSAWKEWCDSLEHMGLSQERRKLVLQPANFSWKWLEQEQKPSLTLRFALGTGDYATSILREVINLQSKV
jgi:tRNA pseudouridine13 synthase